MLLIVCLLNPNPGVNFTLDDKQVVSSYQWIESPSKLALSNQLWKLHEISINPNYFVGEFCESLVPYDLVFIHRYIFRYVKFYFKYNPSDLFVKRVQFQKLNRRLCRWIFFKLCKDHNSAFTFMWCHKNDFRYKCKCEFLVLPSDWIKFVLNTSELPDIRKECEVRLVCRNRSIRLNVVDFLLLNDVYNKNRTNKYSNLIGGGPGRPRKSSAAKAAIKAAQQKKSRSGRSPETIIEVQRLNVIHQTKSRQLQPDEKHEAVKRSNTEAHRIARTVTRNSENTSAETQVANASDASISEPFKFPTPLNREAAREIARESHELMEKLRKVCLVCNRFTDDDELKTFKVSSLSDSLKNKLRCSTLLPEVRAAKLQRQSNAVANNGTGEIPHFTSPKLPDWVIPVPKPLQEFYDVTGTLGAYFKDCLLSKHGILSVEDEIYVVICEACLGHVQRFGQHYSPPQSAIANNLFIGAPPRELNPLNDTDKACLRLYNPFAQFNIVQRFRQNSKLHSSVSMFSNGRSVAIELDKTLPNVLDKTNGDLMVILEGFEGNKTTDERSFIERAFYANADTLRQWFVFLSKNNPFYESCKWSEGHLGVVINAQNADGSVVEFVSNSEEVEASTPIGPTTNDVLNNDGEDDGNLEIISEDSSVRFHVVSGDDEQNDLNVDVKQFQDKFNVDLTGLRLKPSPVRAFPDQEGVLEGAVINLFPYGCGGLKVPRQTSLSTLEYFQTTQQLADGDFGKDRMFIAIATECLRWEQMCKSSYRLSGSQAKSLVYASVDHLEQALRERVKESAKFDGNHVPDDNTLDPESKAVLSAVRRVYSSVVGSKEAKHAALNNLKGLTNTLGLPDAFITFNPGRRDSILYFNHATGKLHKEPPFPLPREVMQGISGNIEGHAYSFHRAIMIFIKKVLGWDIEKGVGRLTGLFKCGIRGFFGVPESTGQGYLHSHWLVWFNDWPRGPKATREMREKFCADFFDDKFCTYAESVATSGFPKYFEYSEEMRCTKCGSNTVPIEGGVPPRFRLNPKIHYGSPNVVKCSSATCKWAITGEAHIKEEARRIFVHYGIIAHDGDIDAKFRDIMFSGGLVELDEPSNGAEDDGDYNYVNFTNALKNVSDPMNAAYLEKHRIRLIADAKSALLFLMHQYHKHSHTDTCFKKGGTCRMKFPKNVKDTSTIDEGIDFKRGIFDVYFNTCLEEVTRAFQCNTDIKFLLTHKDIGSIVAYYIVKYIAKEQDSFARAKLNMLLVTTLERLVKMRDEKLNSETGSATMDEDGIGQVDDKKIRSVALSVVKMIYNLYRKGEELDLPMCSYLILNGGKEYWCSHSFATVYLNDIVHEVFAEDYDAETRIFDQVEDAPSADKKFIVRNQHLQYIGRPKELEMSGLYWFFKHGFMDRIKKTSPRNILRFVDSMKFAKYFFYCPFPRPDLKSVTLNGYSLPDHFRFEKNPIDVINHIAANDDASSTSSSFDADEDNMSCHCCEDIDFDETNDDDDDIVAPGEYNDTKPTQDRRNRYSLKFKTTKQKQELFSFIVCYLFVPYRDIHTLRMINEESGVLETWWECFLRLGPTFDDKSKQVLTTMLEIKVSPSVRKEHKVNWSSYNLDAQEDARNAKANFKNEGGTGYDHTNNNGEDLDGDQLPTEQQTLEAFKRLLEQKKEEERNEIIRSGLVDSNGNSRINVGHTPVLNEELLKVTTDDVAAYKEKFLKLATTSASQPPPPQLPQQQVITTTGQSYGNKRLKGTIEINPKDLLEATKDRFHLNIQQTAIFYKIGKCILRAISNYDSTSSDSNTRTPLYCLLMGEGGTGKSHVIKALTSFCEELGRRGLLLKASQFGSTASAISGYTLAYLCGQHTIGAIAKYSPDKHKDIFEKVGVLIIEEYSLVDKKCLSVLDQALRKAKGCESGRIFGGVDVLFVGDCFQLPPIGSQMLHDPKGGGMQEKYLQSFFVNEVTDVHILTQQMRYTSSGGLIALARALRSRNFNENLVNYLNQKRVSLEDIDFSKAILLVATVSEKVQFSLEYRRQMERFNSGSFIGWRAAIKDTDHYSEEDMIELCDRLNLACLSGEGTSKSSYNKSLEGFSIFRENELVCCKENLCVEGNIANGTFGRIIEFRFPDDVTYSNFTRNDVTLRLASQPPVSVIIETMSAGSNLGEWGTNHRPIWRSSSSMTIDWKGGKKRFTLENIPIVSAVVSTVHGIQGKTIPDTYDIVLTNFRRFWHAFPAAGFYVALTRPVKDTQLKLLDHSFNLKKLEKYAPSDAVFDEYGRLWRLNEMTYVRDHQNQPIPQRLDGPRRHRAHIDEPIGLPNPNNCCWINSSLQLLACLDDSPIRPLVNTDKPKVKQLKTVLNDALNAMKSSNAAILEGKYAQSVGTHSTLEMGIQHDIDELFFKYSKAIINRGYTETIEIRCARCNHKIQANETKYEKLQMNCPQDNVESLDTMLPNSNVEIITGPQCNKKGCKSNSFKKVVNIKYGSVLMIFIARNLNGVKLQTHVNFPQTLVDDSNSNTGLNHQLRGIIEHRGKEATHGHFVAYVNHPEHYDRFYEVDDEYVSTWRPFESVEDCLGISQVQASVLLYERL